MVLMFNFINNQVKYSQCTYMLIVLGVDTSYGDANFKTMYGHMLRQYLVVFISLAQLYIMIRQMSVLNVYFNVIYISNIGINLSCILTEIIICS